MSQEAKVAKIGFVGAGGHATGSLYPTIHTIPEIDLVAVCDLKEELARRNARNFGARRWYTDLDKMFAEEELDGAIVCGVPKMHCEVGKRCLDAGLPILVEKPSAMTSGEAADLARYADERGLFGAVAYMKRLSTCYRMAKSITEKEEFGGVNAIEVRFSHGAYPKIWGIEDNAQVYLIGQVVHLHNLIRFFCGEVDEVYARLKKIDDDGRFVYAITVAFKSGALGVLNFNTLDSFGWKISEYVSISGFGCRVEVTDMVDLQYFPPEEPLSEFKEAGRDQSIRWRPDWTELLSTKAEGAFGYRGEIQNFARAVLGLEKCASDLWDGAKDLQIGEAIWASAQSGKPEKVG